MLPCLRPSSSSPVISNSQHSFSGLRGHYVDGTSRSSALPSPTINLVDEYKRAIETSKIHLDHPSDQTVEQLEVNYPEEPPELKDVLKPSREYVQEAMSSITHYSHHQLVSNCFDHSEHTAHLCLCLYRNVHNARLLYDPIQKFLDALPLDFDTVTRGLSQCECDWAFEIFVQFDNLGNPFPGPDSDDFDDVIRGFLKLKEQLDLRLHQSHSKVSLVRCATRGSAICLIATAVGVTVSAVVIATHALVALVATPVCPAAFLPFRIARKEAANVAQLDDAARGIFVLHHYLESIKCLVSSLHTAIEGDKNFIRIGLERGRDRHLILAIVKNLRSKRETVLAQIAGLENDLCLCVAAVKDARDLLLKHVLHQNC